MIKIKKEYSSVIKKKPDTLSTKNKSDDYKTIFNSTFNFKTIKFILNDGDIMSFLMNFLVKIAKTINLLHIVYVIVNN